MVNYYVLLGNKHRSWVGKYSETAAEILRGKKISTSISPGVSLYLPMLISDNYPIIYCNLLYINKQYK